MTPLKKACSIFGSQNGIAALLGITPMRLWNWKQRGLPRTEFTGETNYAYKIELAVNGEVTKEELLKWSLSRYKEL